MKSLHRLFLLPLPLLFCPLRAEFNPAVASADAQWVVSLDLNELRDSTFGKELLDLAQQQMKFNTTTSVGNLQLNFPKLLETVGSITAYGSNFSPDPKLIDGTLVVQGTDDLRKITEALALQATLVMPDKVTEVKDLPFEAYAVGGDVLIAFPPEPVILISKSKAQLLKARDVVRGAAPSLAKAPSSRLAGLLAKSAHAYVVAASIAPTEKLFAADGPQARILQLANSGMFALSEEEPRTVARLQLVANSDEMADKLLKIVQGMVAMMSLAESSDKDLAAFLQSAVVEKQDRTVSVQLAYSSQRLVDMVKSMQQQMNTAPAAMRMPGPPSAPMASGKVVAEWKPNQAAAGALPGTALLADHAIENVSLVSGSIITLTGRRDLSGQRDRGAQRGGAAVFDYVEILPETGPGIPLRFEAENMRLQGYRVTNAPYASRGKFISLPGSFGSAQFEFPGEDGVYQLHVHYLEEVGGKTSLAANVKDPEPAPVAK